MDSLLEEKFEHLAETGHFQEIVDLVEQIPESTRDQQILGWYVRSLNNSNDYERAAEVSQQYKQQGESDPMWHYRYAFALLHLDRLAETEVELNQFREMIQDGSPQLQWADELTEALVQRRDGPKARAESEARRRAKKVAVDPNQMPFAGFDFTDFWDDDNYALEEYVGSSVTDEMIQEVESQLGYKLPASYIYLMRLHNGGTPNNTAFPIDEASDFEPATCLITGILGLDENKPNSLTGEFGTKFMNTEWGYPDIGVAIADCPSVGHDLVFLDYRSCGPEGEPEVVHVDQECDFRITYLAGDFESFILGLVKEEYDYEDDPDLEITDVADYLKVAKSEQWVDIWFYIEYDKPWEVGEKISALNPDVYMNGYNWDVLLKCYLIKRAPDLLDGLETDPEADSYAARYEQNPENEAKALKVAQIIHDLIEHPENLRRFVQEEGEEIEWD